MQQIELTALDFEKVRDYMKIWASWLRTASGVGRLSYSGFVVENLEAQIEAWANAPEFDENNEPIALLVEKAMCKLKQIAPKIFKALVYEYYFEYTDKQSAEALHCSEASFRAWRKNGEHFIAGHLA